MTKKKTYTRTLEQETAYNAFQAMVRELSKEVKEEALTEQTQALATHAKSQEGLSRYSFFNQLLILKQRPGAVEVHTFNGWREQGKRVLKGSKAIRVIAPHSSKEDGESVITGFHSILIKDQDRMKLLNSLTGYQYNQKRGEDHEVSILG